MSYQGDHLPSDEDEFGWGFLAAAAVIGSIAITIFGFISFANMIGDFIARMWARL